MKLQKTIIFAVVIILAAGCASTRVRTVELENKGTTMNISTPDWVRSYTQYGVTRLQTQSQFRDRYVVIGEETGVNRQFVLSWADSFSAQQRIGSMLRTTIASEYNAKVQGTARSESVSGLLPSAGTYQQEIDSIINAIVNVSYSGAQREADWWSLSRRYDPDVKDKYTDSYTAWVMYTIPKSLLNEQVARALETSVRADSALYEITIEMARQILLNGFAEWGAE